MRVEDLGISELVQFDTEEGVIRFAGERALIIDATAKGTLRKELISRFGVSAARAVLTRFGYLSRAVGKEIYVLEDRCIGKGATACHLIGRTMEEWGDDRSEELRFYRADNLREWLEPSLHQITENLKDAERRLRERTNALNRVAPEVDDPLGLINRSPDMRRVVDLARRIARIDPRGKAARYRHGDALPETQELPRRTSRPGHSPRVTPGALPTPRS